MLPDSGTAERDRPMDAPKVNFVCRQLSEVHYNHRVSDQRIIKYQTPSQNDGVLD